MVANLSPQWAMRSSGPGQFLGYWLGMAEYMTKHSIDDSEIGSGMPTLFSGVICDKCEA
jgi:hypothetical protein